VTTLWLPGAPLVDSVEAWALDDLAPPPPADPDPWAGLEDRSTAPARFVLPIDTTTASDRRGQCQHLSRPPYAAVGA